MQPDSKPLVLRILPPNDCIPVRLPYNPNKVATKINFSAEPVLPHRPDYFISERHTYFQRVEMLIDYTPSPQVGWEESIANVPFRKRGGCNQALGPLATRSSYFRPIERPVWKWEFCICGEWVEALRVIEQYLEYVCSHL